MSCSLATEAPKPLASTVEPLIEGCSHMEVSDNTKGIQGHFRVTLISFWGICFTAIVCNMTGLRDESHSLYITSDVFVPPYTASILAFALSISQPASLHVALTPSAGFCVQYSSFLLFFLAWLQPWNTSTPFALELINSRWETNCIDGFAIRWHCHCNQHD